MWVRQLRVRRNCVGFVPVPRPNRRWTKVRLASNSNTLATSVYLYDAQMNQPCDRKERNSNILDFSLEVRRVIWGFVTHLTHFSNVNGNSVIIVDVSSNWLFLQCAPCNLSPLTPKLLSLWLASPPPCSVIVTSSASSSNDQLFACATHWRVAVIYASGFKRPPSQTGKPCDLKWKMQILWCELRGVKSNCTHL